MRSLDLGRASRINQIGSSIRGQLGTSGLPNLKKGNNERNGKGPATNVIDITLVLVPRAPK